MPDHQWYYIESGLLGETTVGPIDEIAFITKIRNGRVMPEWNVLSATRTNNQWFPMRQIPGCLQAWQEGEAQRADQSRAKNERALLEREAAAKERAATNLARHEAADRERQELGKLSDSPNLELVRHIRDSTTKLLTAQEQIHFICIQEKPVINVKPDAMVCTNRRLIFYRPKLLGRFDFTDYLWRDLSNAHLAQGILGSTFSAQHTSGIVVQMDYLPKESAMRLYRFTQQREEEAFHARREMMMEERRAGAMQIAIQNNSAPPAPPVKDVAALPPPAAGGDFIQRLQTLKAMFDQQLISQQEYDTRKAQILSQI